MLLQYLCLIINHQFNPSRQCLILNLKYSQVTYLPSEEHFQLRHYFCWEKGYELIFPYSILLLYAVLMKKYRVSAGYFQFVSIHVVCVHKT